MNHPYNISSKSLNPPVKLKDSIVGTISAINSIATAEHRIETITMPKNKFVPQLETHDKDAKDIAVHWRTDIFPAVINTLQGIDEYGKLFDSLYRKLSLEAQAIKKNADDTNAIRKFKANISELYSNADKIYKQSTAIQTKVSTFQNNLNTNSRNFSTDFKGLKKIENASKTQLTLYTQHMNSLLGELAAAKEKQKILENPWVVVFSFGLSEIISLIENLDGQVANLQNQLSNAYTAVQQEKSVMASLTNVAHILSTLVTLSTHLITFSTVFVNRWQAFSDNLKVLEQMIYIRPDDSWAQSDLEAVNLEWKDIVEEAKNI